MLATEESKQVVGIDPERVESAVGPPLDWVLVRLDPPMEKTEGGITIPGQSIPPARTGVVVKIGPGALSDDGKTRLPMHCRPGQRVLFERAAGKGLPRCPRETERPRTGSAGRWAYLLMRDGSVCASIDPLSTSDGEQRALDSGDANLPPRPQGGPPVSRCGALSWERIRPVQDWMIIEADLPSDEVDAAPRRRGIARPTGKRDRKGRPIYIVEHEQEERAPLWTGTILRRGPGLMTVTRCLDGDRVGEAPHIAEQGQRVLYWGEEPYLQQWNPLKTIAQERAKLVREYPCVVAVVADEKAA